MNKCKNARDALSLHIRLWRASIREQPTSYMSETIPAPAIDPSAAQNQAKLGQRAGAYLIDAVIAILIAVIVSTVIGFISDTLAMLLSLVGAAYFVTRDALPFLGGQSVGKKLLGIRAVTTDGKSLSGNWSPGLVRNAVLLIPFFPLVELIILFTKQDAPEGLLRLGDQWAGTQVIIEKK